MTAPTLGRVDPDTAFDDQEDDGPDDTDAVAAYAREVVDAARAFGVRIPDDFPLDQIQTRSIGFDPIHPEGIYACEGCGRVYPEYLNGCLDDHGGSRRVALVAPESEFG